MARRFLSLKSAAVLLIVGSSLLFSTNSFGMLKLCLFSPVRGIVVLNGQPVAGAVIERTCDWRVKETDQTVTDERGEFSLPGIYSWLGIVQLMPHEPVIHQQILIKHERAIYNAWSLTKHEYGEFAELNIAASRGVLPNLNDKPIYLYCELTIEPKNHGGVWGYGGLAELRQLK